MLQDFPKRSAFIGVECPHCKLECEWVDGRCTCCGGDNTQVFTPKDRREVKNQGRSDTPFHFDAGKPRTDQLPPEALIAVANVFGYGAAKYGEDNWRDYENEWEYRQLYASTLRHLFAWVQREDIDPESGLDHLSHAAANILMLITLVSRGAGKDDRWKEKP